MSDQPPPVTHPRYQNPPVTERAIRVDGKISEETYQRGLEAWSQAVSQEFPHHIQKVRWNLAIKSESDLPLIEHSKSSVIVRQRYWSSDPAKGHAKFCLQLEPDCLIVNLRRKPFSEGPDLSRFEDLQTVFEQWYIIWCRVFTPSVVSQVSVEYWNRFDKWTVPDYANDHRIDASKLLTVFATVPSPAYCGDYVAPYFCKHVRKAMLNNRDYTVSVETSTVSTDPIALQVDTRVRRQLAGETELGQCIAGAHELVLCAFDATVTDLAKAAFGATET